MCLYDETPQKKLEKSKHIKIAAPRPLSSRYHYMITALLGIRLGYLRFSQKGPPLSVLGWILFACLLCQRVKD